MAKKKYRNQLIDSVASTLADRQTRNLTERSLETFKGTRILVDGAKKYKNVAADKRAGRIFEDQSVLRFNQKAAELKRKARAATTDSLGNVNDPKTDIVIKSGSGKAVRKIQAKTSKQGESTLESMVADPKYKKQDALLTPSDQAAKVKSRAEKLASRGGRKGKDHSRAAQRTKGNIEYRGVNADGVSSNEVMFATNNPNLYKCMQDVSALAKECHAAGHTAGCSGAAFGVGFAIFQGVHEDKEADDVAVDVMIEGGKGYAMAYTSAALAKGGAHVLQKIATDAAQKAAATAATKALAQEAVKKSVLASAPKVLLRGNAHVAFAAAVIQAGVAMGQYLNGDLSKEEMLENVSQTAVTGASAFYYGLVGQALCPIPVVGALVGSTVGFFIGNLIHKAGLVCLGDDPELKAARERRAAITAMVAAAIPRIRAYREELERKLRQYLDTQADLFDECLGSIEASLDSGKGGMESFIASCDALCKNFGTSLAWQTQEEFDVFMEKDDVAFVL